VPATALIGQSKMILRRIVHAIRKQDWSTIVVEILIVVIGILIGLQVDGWNERRETRRLYQTALNAFLVESTANRMLLDERIQQMEQRIPVLEKALRHLVRCEPAPGIDATLDAVVDMSYRSIRPDQAFVAYEAVATSTRFQEVMSERFRLRLNSYYSHFLKRHEWLVRNAATIDPATRFEESKSVAVIETDDDSSVYRQFRWQVDAPFASVCADREFIRDAVSLHSIHAVNLRLSREMQRERDLFDVELRGEIDRFGR
jgi:hypothetical protein